MRTPWEHLHAASLLLVGPGGVKQRLAAAYRTHLADLHPESLPRELRAELASIAQALTHERPVGGLGAIEASVRKMSDAEAASLAARVIGLFGEVSQLQSGALRATPLRVVASGQD
jgi:hypothetical protein